MVDLEENANKYCYTCLKLDIGRTSYMRLDFSIPGDIPYTKKLKFCIPEMLLEDIDACILCKQCSIALDSAYLFRVMCLETETKLQSLRQHKEINVVNSLQEEPSILGFNVVDVRSLCGSEQSSDTTNIASFEATGTTDTEVYHKTPLTDEEIIAKCCETIPALKGLTPESLQCWVTGKKIVPIRFISNKRNQVIPTRRKQKLWCSMCDKYILGKSHYQFHLKRHLKLAFVCNDCSVDCNNQNNFSRHKSVCPKRNKVEEKIIPSPPKLKKKPSRDVTIKKKTKIMKVKINGKIKKVIQRGIYHCKICTFKANKKSIMKSHNIGHVGTPPYRCNYCSKIFKDCNKFIRHMNESKHSKSTKAIPLMEQPIAKPVNEINPPTYECNLCSKTFRNINKFLYHMQEHNKPTKKKTYIQQPIKKSTSNVGTPPFQCTFCLKIFQENRKYRRHMRLAKHTRLTNHAEPAKKKAGIRRPIPRLEEDIGSPPFICPSCSKVFHISSKFLRHMREAKHTRKIHNIKKTRVQVEVKPERHFCDVCDMAFISEVELSDHRETLHQNAKNLNLHEESFHQNAENCNLDEEQLHHNRENCEVAEETLNQNAENGNISEEVVDIVNATVESFNEYYCNICTTKFKKLEFFFNHNCTMESLEPVYSCHLCNMSLSSRISLIEHMEVHFNATS